MTSDVDFQTVRKTLFDIQSNRRNFNSTNLLLATSTISHGVDEDSFNLMYFFGMPNNNAEYIQAYSRTGRKHTGIVIDIIRLMRVRDRSYLSESERRHILKYLMDKGIVAKYRIIEYLQFFINNALCRPNMSTARTRWESDLNWVRAYQIN